MKNGEHQAISIGESNSNTEMSDGSINEIEEPIDNARAIPIQEVVIDHICRVPQSLARISMMATKPEMVSIGPYHRDKDEVREFQSYKLQFRDSLLSRIEEPQGCLLQMTEAMTESQDDARREYSEPIAMSRDDFIEMMLLDGCFIIELFQQLCRSEDSENANRLVVFMKPWIIPILIRDLLKLENQLPLFVLVKLHSLSVGNASEPLILQAFKFFHLALPRSLESFKDPSRLDPYENRYHLLDLFYSSYCFLGSNFCQLSNLTTNLRIRSHGSRRYRPLSDQSVPCVTRLRHAGVKFRPLKGDHGNFLGINFHKGVLEIPTMTINDFTSTILINCTALEQCYPQPQLYFSEYIAFMSCLINSSRDVTFLCDDGIFSNFSYNDQRVANLFMKLGERVAFNIRECYLSSQFRELEAYYSSSWATLRRTHFSSPWSTISVVSAAFLLALTVIQTIIAILSYKFHHS